MSKYITSIGIIFFLLICSITTYSAEYTISLTIRGFANQQVLISKTEGDLSMYIDTLTSDATGCAVAKFDDTYTVGMYSFVIPKLRNAEVEFIFNKEVVILQTEATSPQTFVKVMQSKENEIYYNYKQFQQIKNSDFQILEYTHDHYTGKDYLEQTEKEYQKLLSNYNTTFNEFLSKSKGLFVAKIIASSHVILPQELLSASEKAKYVQTHFFDYINFADTSLFATSIFTDACIDFLKTYSNQYQSSKNNSVFKQAVDTIFSKTIAYPETFDFITDYLINGFETMGASEIVQYISELYLSQKSCKQSETPTTLQEKALNNTELAVGKPIPSFSIIDSKNNTYSDKEIANQQSVIIFWASWCPHCTQMLPKIMADYGKSKKLYSLYTISLDENIETWKTFISLYPDFAKASNSCDGKSWESPTIKSFHIYATPSIFIVKDGKIVGKPLDFEGYKKMLQKNGFE